MAHNPDRDERHARDERLARRIGSDERRTLRARAEPERGVWFGLGMYGLVGWSIAVPTVLAVILGVWIDERYPSRLSWTLMLLAVGLVLGCATAWFWIAREQRAIARHPSDDGGAGARDDGDRGPARDDGGGGAP